MGSFSGLICGLPLDWWRLAIGSKLRARGTFSVLWTLLCSHAWSRRLRLAGCRNTEVVAVTDSGSEVVATLKIRPEPFTEGTDKKQHMQWFYFK